VGYRSRASEFPNDNAEISGGTIWICEDLTGPATRELAAPQPIEATVPFAPVEGESFVLYFDDDETCIDGPAELEIEGASLSVAVCSPEYQDTALAEAEAALAEAEPEHASQAEDAPVAPAFTHFESALIAALLAQGASRSAALVPRLLRLESLTPDALSKDVLLTLQSRGYLDGNARYSAKYRDLCGAWTAVLRGSSQDFAACGTTTLDRFGADLLAALLAVPATRADELRRDLRKAGIAAFGVLEAA
jgi:hypothetical protein